MARCTTGIWTDPSSGINHVHFRYLGETSFESTGTRNPGEAQVQANLIFAEVVSGRHGPPGTKAVAEAPSRHILLLGAAWLEEIEAELMKSTQGSVRDVLRLAPRSLLQDDRSRRSPHTLDCEAQFSSVSRKTLQLRGVVTSGQSV
jgi:hypothetical protein